MNNVTQNTDTRPSGPRLVEKEEKPDAFMRAMEKAGRRLAKEKIALAAASTQVSRAVAAYDAALSDKTYSMAEVGKMFEEEDEKLLKAIGLLQCARNEIGEFDTLDDAAALLTRVRETLLVCVREQLKEAGVFGGGAA